MGAELRAGGGLGDGQRGGHTDVAARAQVAAVRALAEEVEGCRRCPRLVQYTAEVARKKRRAYAHWDYWGRPVPSFGDPLARLMVVGLAPAAHGANRTGRMFTGDSSGDWLYRALHRAGFANQPTSTHVGDGLQLYGTYITATCHCAPPDNKPSREEIEGCAPFLARELEAMATVRVIVCLGQLAFNNVLHHMRQRGYGWPVETGAGEGAQDPPSRPRKPPFAHGGEYRWVGGPAGRRPPVLLASYHPSRQNTNTGVLTEGMFDAVFRRAKELLAAE